MKKWRVLNSEVAFQTHWVKIRKDEVKLPNGEILDDYYVWEDGDVVLVVPYTVKGEIVLVHQYKHAVGEMVIEFPAGYVDEDEKPLEAARRELAEETGYHPKKIEQTAVLTNNPTKIQGNIFVFKATGCTKRHDQKFDKTEDIEILHEKSRKVLKMIKNGKIWVSASVAAGLLELTND